MATTYQITGLREVVAYTTLSFSTNQTNTIVYNAATVLANLQAAYPAHQITTANAQTIKHIYASYSSAATTPPVAVLNWDATTPVVALDIPSQTNPIDSSFACFGGIQSLAGSGNTGNITLTTTGAGSTDVITIVLTVILAANNLITG